MIKKPLPKVNMTEIEYLTTVLGPRFLPLDIVVAITIVYGTIFTAGIIGNIMTCLVVLKNQPLRKTINYYLFSLAIANLLLLILGK